MNDIPAPAKDFITGLEPEDVQRLNRLLATLRMVDGWCRVNRIIAKWVIYTAIAGLVMLWKGYDALLHLWAAFRGQ